jgi:uncharacterized protein YjbI with pentapeptide repeats
MTREEIIRSIALGADVSGVKMNHLDFADADLSGIDLDSSHLNHAHLHRTNLSCANLFYADMMQAYMVGANLRGANLASANLMGACLVGADLRDANLTCTVLDRTDLYQARLSGARFGDYICREWVGRVLRSDGYEFNAFRLIDDTLFIRAGCRSLTLAKYREHIADAYPYERKAAETTSILNHLSAFGS